MNKFQYVPSEIFMSEISYPDPNSEYATREQFSRPLEQVKEFINNSIVAEVNGKASADHSHEDKYYNKETIDQKLEAKANATHTHDYSDITNMPRIMYGTIEPNRLMGKNGDIYIKISLDELDQD